MKALGAEVRREGNDFDAAKDAAKAYAKRINGMARWIKAASPAMRVLGVRAAGADAMEKSWRNKTIISPDTADTIADGIAVRAPIPEAVDDMQGLVDDMLLITDAHIVEAMRLAYQHAGLLLEPAGAVGVAAIVAHRALFADKKVATVLCGSNVTES